MVIAQVGEGVHTIDLAFQGQPGVIAAYLVEDAGERALVETGPASTLDALLDGLAALGIEPETISKVLVTHIHLDHAGAAGSFIRRFPQAQLYVHEIGAPHLIDPTKLLSSATRIYGDMMGPLWGAFEPVPEEKITILTDDEVIPIGSRRLRALYTPGHASHHVIYHDEAHEAVFTGDLAAVRLQGFDYVRPPTPPPDISLELWSESLQRLRDLNPRTLYLTHFGAFSDVTRHLQEVHDRLYAWSDIVAAAQQRGQERAEIVDTLLRHGDRELLESSADQVAAARYELATPYGMSVDGYLRYFRKSAASRG